MTANKNDNKKGKLISSCNAEIDRQENILGQIAQVLQLYITADGNILHRTLEYDSLMIEHRQILSAIEEEFEIQNDLKNKIDDIKEYLEFSSYSCEMEVHLFLQAMIKKVLRKTEKKVGKNRLNRKQVQEYNELLAKCKKEESKNYRMNRMLDELKAAKSKNRELKAMYDQKKKRHEELKKTLEAMKERREKIKEEKEKLLKELEELEKKNSDSDTESDTESDSDSNTDTDTDEVIEIE